MIIHVLPDNISVCGGVKVHYDLCELERSLDIKSVIAFPNSNNVPTWLKRNVGKVLSYAEAKELGYKEKKQGKSVIVIGWEDPDILTNGFRDFINVCYIQGDVFWRGINHYTGKFILCGSNYIKNKINVNNCFVIEPFVNNKIFYPSSNKQFKKNIYKILIQARKGGKEAFNNLYNNLYKHHILDRFEFDILDDVDEHIFAEKLRQSDILFTHSYPEGFNLPVIEAMASKTFVIGFSGGGGTEFMKDEENCFYSNDGDYVDLVYKIKRFLLLTEKQLEIIILNAYNTSKVFSIDRTRNKLINFLNLINNKNILPL